MTRRYRLWSQWVGIAAILLASGAYAYFYYATYQYCDKPYVDQTPVTDCDRLAADPEDPDRVAPPVWPYMFNPKQAAETCQRALMNYPNSARLRYISAYIGAINGEKAISSLAKQCYRRAISLEALRNYPSPKKKGSLDVLKKFLGDRILQKAQGLQGGDAYFLNAAFFMIGLNGYSKDEAKALPLLQHGTDLGSIFATEKLAEIYYFGTATTPKDLSKAAPYAFKAADAGMVSGALFSLRIIKEDPSLSVPEERQAKWKAALEVINEKKAAPDD